MPKFFVSKSQIDSDFISIVGEDVTHISKVLRMNAGDYLKICDGLGTDYDTEIRSIEKSEIKAEIIKRYRCEAEPNVEVVLFQALPKQGKMEYIIQKNTELGIAKIVPVYSKRCVAKPTDKITRWQKVAVEAAKQSGRGVVPQICETISFSDAIEQMLLLNHAVMLYEGERNARLKTVLEGKDITQIGILVGPEGGFDDFEAELAREKEIPTVTLGNRILRTETAGAAVLPIIMYSQNDI